uniref:SRCR domain-containing protein n=1 Tax=Sparus aurata TaxID=8175 RepID=A0A671TTP5_SPAAU
LTKMTKSLSSCSLILLVNGTNLCSGRLEVKSNQRWSSVCEDDFDQQDAEVVCRELGCGAPSVLQGALYGEVEAPMWTKEFQCGGHESALLDCRTSGSDRNTCSPGEAVGLTCSGRRGAAALMLFDFLSNVTSFSSFTLVCSEPDIVRLVGGSSRCAGEVEVKQHGVWRKVIEEKSQWNLKTADAVCRQLDCDSAVSTGPIQSLPPVPVWTISSTCLQSGSAVSDCVTSTTDSSKYHLEVKCSDSIRLVNGNSLCSGRLEVKSNQRWSSVCEDDFDQQDAEVVCRELGCGAPSVLQGALYGEVEAPMWTKEFQCGGHESALLDCRTSGSDRNTCSPGKAVGLTCSGRKGAAALILYEFLLNVTSFSSFTVVCSESDFVRLVGGSSRCAGELEVKQQGVWRKVIEEKTAALILFDFLSNVTSFSCFTLVCSEANFVRLVGRSSRCAGELEVKQRGVWRKVIEEKSQWNLKTADAVCRQLDCDSAVSTGLIQSLTSVLVWGINSTCLQSGSAVSDCVSSTTDSSEYHLEVKCSGNTSKHISCDGCLVVYISSFSRSEPHWIK